MEAQALVERIANEETLPGLEALSSPLSLLVSAAHIVAQAGDREAIETLLPEARQLAREAISDPGGIDEIVKALDRPDSGRVALVLAGVLAPLGDERSLDAAARLCESALAAAPEFAGAAIALRLVRLYEELDRPADLARAYAEALRRNPLSSWLYPPSSIGAEGERIEQEAIERSSGHERTLREAIGAVRRGTGAIVRLEEISYDPEIGAGAGLLIVAEELRVVAGLDPEKDREAIRLSLIHARAHADALEAFGPLAPLAHALIAILEGDRARAIAILASGLPPGEADPHESAAAIVDALEREIRLPPHRVDEILRRAFFEAVLDPFAAFDPPRSAFAKLRHWIAGAALGLAITTAMAPIAEADTPADGVALVGEEGPDAEPTEVMLQTQVDMPAVEIPPAAATPASPEHHDGIRGGYHWQFHFAPRHRGSH